MRCDVISVMAAAASLFGKDIRSMQPLNACHSQLALWDLRAHDLDGLTQGGDGIRHDGAVLGSSDVQAER